MFFFFFYLRHYALSTTPSVSISQWRISEATRNSPVPLQELFRVWIQTIQIYVALPILRTMYTELLVITHCLVGVGTTPSHLLVTAMLVWCICRLIILHSSDGLGSGVQISLCILFRHIGIVPSIANCWFGI